MENNTLTLTQKGQEKADQVRAVEEAMYQMITNVLAGVSLADITTLLWRFVEGRPAGEALARRAGRSPFEHEG